MNVWWGLEVKIYNGNYDIDNQVIEPILKDKLTVTEYFEQGVEYGSKIIEINGKILKIDKDNKSFRFTIFSEKFDSNRYFITTNFDSKFWKDNEVMKKQLLSIEPGDEISIKGLFGGPNVMWIHQFDVMSINSINSTEFIENKNIKTNKIENNNNQSDEVSKIAESKDSEVGKVVFKIITAEDKVKSLDFND